MPKPTPEAIGMWGGEIFVFPNLMILPQAGNAMIYRVRPDGNDPDKCIFEIMSTKTYPAAAKVPRAVMQTVTDLEDPEQVLQIPRQDLGNIPRIDRKSVVSGKSVSVRVDLGGRRIIKKKKNNNTQEPK